MKRLSVLLLAGLAASFAATPIAHGEDYPTRQITLIAPWPAGGAVDALCRAVAPPLSERLGKSVVVENRPGAGSAVGAEYVARAAKDGYTLFLSTLSIVTAQAMKPDPNFDLVRDFAPISLLASGAVVLVVNPDSNLRSVADIIALAKRKPGEVLCANAGVGSLPHFSGELFAQRAGIKVTHVPYPGSPQAVNDLIGGRVTMFFSPASTVIGQIAAGKLRALAVAAETRASSLPDVPSMAEAGMRDFDTSLWFGLLAPVGTPRAAIDKVAAAAAKAMHAPEAVEMMKKQGFDPIGNTPEAFGPYLKSEVARWADVAKAAGVKS
jgi:tripartite-type tricarboxylate transporter receptor subunit TctC